MTATTGTDARGELFFPELVSGAAALDGIQRAALSDYFSELAARRGYPIHPVVAWNALYWGFDLDTGRYLNPPFERLVPVTGGTQIDALPIGAFIRVPAGRDEFWGEIVYKEGRHADLDPDWIQPALSGAPVDVSDLDGHQVAIVREALVADFDVLEPANEHSLERQRQRENVIDRRHHLVIDAVYDLDDAEIDDATYFARWMLAMHRDDLVSGRFGAGLVPEVLDDDALVLAALVSSLATIRDVMAATPTCLTWRDYAFDASKYARRLAATDEPLCGPDVDRLAMGLTRVPRDALTGYVALGPRLIDELGDDAELHGPGWVAAVCHLSRYIIDKLVAEAPGGVMDTGLGVVHLRLDDAWQAGGIWRTQVLPGGWDPICAIAPDVPLGLGFAEASGTATPDHVGAGDVEPDPECFEVSATELGTTVVLHPADITRGRLRLPRQLYDSLRELADSRGGDTVTIRLGVEGYEVASTERAQLATLQDALDTPLRVEGLAWVWPFVVGSKVAVTWTRGAGVLDAFLARRGEPFVTGEFSYDYECDEAVFARGVGAPPPPAAARGQTLRDLVLQAIRRRGEQLPDGSRSADLQRIVLVVYGPDASAPASRSVKLVLDTLCSEQILHCEDGTYAWTPTVGRATQVGDRGLLEEYGAVAISRFVRQPYDVGLFLRRLTVSEHASDERQREYRRIWVATGSPPWLPAELPARMTFVVPHTRGGHHDNPDSSGQDSEPANPEPGNHPDFDDRKYR